MTACCPLSRSKFTLSSPLLSCSKFTLNPGDAAMVAAAADYCNTNAEAPSPALPLTLPNPTVTLLPGSQCGGTGGACNRCGARVTLARVTLARVILAVQGTRA